MITNQRAKDTQRRMVKLLTNPQRSFLGGLADGAFRLMVSRGPLIRTMRARRHGGSASREATAKLDPQGIGWSISEAPAFCFDEIKARFEALAGETDKALETLTGSPTTSARWRTTSAWPPKACGVGGAYIAGICKRQSRDTHDLEHARRRQSRAQRPQQTRAVPGQKARAASLAAAGRSEPSTDYTDTDHARRTYHRPRPRHAETCHPRHLHRPAKRPPKPMPLAMKVKMFYLGLLVKELSEHFRAEHGETREAIKSHTMLLLIHLPPARRSKTTWKTTLA